MNKAGLIIVAALLAIACFAFQGLPEATPQYLRVPAGAGVMDSQAAPQYLEPRRPRRVEIVRDQVSIDSPGSITIGPGSVTIDNIGQGTDHTNPLVRDWKRQACRPGSQESRRYPCVTSMPNGDACQLGNCLPADLYRGNQ